MLSILIPIYNFSISELIQSIQNQCNTENIIYEIIAIDDCSNVEYQEKNREIITYSNVHYEQLPTNIGRAKIRNLLAKKANYSNLLFLDCDSKITSNTFIHNYLQHCNKENIIVCGGTCYDKVRPQSNILLRWKYGRNYEEKKAIKRHSFSAFNFLIHKSIFDSIQFDESISNYGHEDTLFGIALQQKGYHIEHIDNPLQHIGLDTNDIFIQKTKKSIENLQRIKRNISIEYQNTITLLAVLNLCNTMHITKLFAMLYNRIGIQLCNRIMQSKNLMLFNLFKITYICYLENQAR